MSKANLFNISGEVVKSVTLSKEIFDAKVKPSVLTQALRVYMARQHQGTSATKGRGEVRLTTAKMYRQKGTGRARHGAQSAPLFVGGGIAHGPKALRGASIKITKKMAKLSLIAALSNSAKLESISLIESFDKMPTKTKEAANLMTKISNNKKTLVLTSSDATTLRKAINNLEGVTAMPVTAVNALHITRARVVLLDEAALTSLEKRLK